MKKLFLSLFAFIFAHGSFAQDSFVIMPEIGTGIAVIDLLGDNYYKATFHVYAGLTLGITKGNDNGTNFYGMYIARNGYGYSGENPDNGKDCTISRGSFNLGMQFIHRTNLGFSYGGIVGLNRWDKKYLLDDKTYDDADDNSVMILKAKVGYCWSHVGLFLETGYNKGFELNYTVAFPLYSSK